MQSKINSSEFLIRNSLILGPVTTNLILYRTCYVILGYNKSECALLGTSDANNRTKELEEKVQPHASVIMATDSFGAILVSSLLCFFLGAWSDKYGRRPVMLYTIAGKNMFVSGILQYRRVRQVYL